MVKLWQFLKKDISPDAIEGSIDTTEAILGLAEKLQDKGSQIQQLAPLISNIDSLLDVLNLPLVQVAGAGLPFIPIATGVLRFCLNATKHKPSLSESVILVTQVAYLESLKAILNLPVNQAILEQIGKTPVNQTIHQQIKKLGELEIDESEIEKILSLKFFHDSKIAQAFNQILMARLQQAGLDESNAKLLTERVSCNTYRYINKAFEVITNEEEIKSLARYNDRDRRELETIYSLDNYLDKKIAPLPDETVFTEKFTYQQIYVPLKAQLADKNRDLKEKAPQDILQEWVAKTLQTEEKAERVIFIQGAPGSGKSVFCRMFADYVRQNFHPIWTPILIRLRDIVSFEKSIETTLRNAVKADFASIDDGWLSDRNTRYLFLLDGFDELQMEMRTERGIEEFLRKVGQFQQDCNNNSEYGHRVLITGRAIALHGIFQPDNLERIEILPMDNELQQQWFDKWEKVVNQQERKAFETFLQDKCCPEGVRKELAREPLLLYLLAAMHRDKKFTIADFAGKSAIQAKILIYEKSLDRVLTKQRPEALTKELTGLENIEALRRILAEAGLAVMQAGQEYAPISMIEKRLQDNDDDDDNANAKKLLEAAQQRLGDKPLRNALTSFYLRVGSKEGAVEFVHKSFGEFLCAHRFKESLEKWSLKGIRGQEFYISQTQMDWQLYDLLGATNLTPEIVKYLMALLQASPKFADAENIVRLFKRLERFYFHWCEGEFIDAPPENYPQKKMRLLREQLKDRDSFLGQRQVDIYTGLNILILLFELHRYGQLRDDLKDRVNFYPCNQPDSGEFDDTQLLKIISYSDCLDLLSFNQIVGYCLSEADLSEADLSGADLIGADLIGADLIGADLIGANLIEAYLIGANLNNANLDRITWDKNTNWDIVRGLETAKNVPEALKKQLGIG